MTAATRMTMSSGSARLRRIAIEMGPPEVTTATRRPRPSASITARSPRSTRARKAAKVSSAPVSSSPRTHCRVMASNTRSR